MKRFKNAALTGAMLAIVLTGTHDSAAADWPQWRGPDRTDISTETGLLDSWPADGPKLAWLFRDAGIGYSGPAIADGKIFFMGGRGDEEFLIALTEKYGRELWATEIGSLLTNRWGDGPRGTPTVDQDRVYTLSASGTLACVNVGDGSIRWSKTMQSLGGKVPGWGYTESVLVDGDRVVCTPGGSEGTVAALDKMSGKVIWQSGEWTDGAQYSSVIAADPNGKRQYSQLTQETLGAVDATDGSLLWSTEWPGRTAVIPTPIVHDNHVYITSGYGVGCKLVRIDPGNKVTEIYANRDMKNHHGGVLLLDGHVYGYSDGAGWVCQNFMSGETVWREKSALGKGAVSYSDGRLYCVDESDGTIALVEATPDGWKERGRFKLDPQSDQRSRSGRIWTHPVVANGRLYLRDQELFFAFDIKSTNLTRR